MPCCQVIQHPVIMNNGINNKNSRNRKPLVFGSAFNMILDIIVITEEIKTRKQNNTGDNDKLFCYQQFIKQWKIFLCIKKLTQKYGVKEKTEALNNKVEIAFKVISKGFRGFIIICFQKKKQSHGKCEACIVHEFKTAV